jgi:hypothetical protein
MRRHSKLLVRNHDGHPTSGAWRHVLLCVAAAAVIAGLAGLAVNAAGAATWSSAVTVPDSAAGSDAVIARDGAGADTVAWLQGGAGAAPDRIVASSRLLGAPFSSRILSADAAAPVDPPAIADDPTGPVTIAWVANGPQIDYAVGGAGELSARQTLPPALTGADPASVDVAVNAGGETIFTWTQTIGGVSRIRAAVRSADGALSGAATLSDGSANASEPRAAAAAGGAVVAWVQTAETTTTAGNRETTTTVARLQHARRTPSGFTPGATVTEATEKTVTTTSGANETSVTTGQELESPQVAADDQGEAAVAFLLTSVNEHDPPRPADSRTSAAQLSSGPLSTGVGSPAAISPPGQDAGGPSLSVARNGAGVLAWTAGPSVHAARRAAGGSYGADELVIAAGSDPATAIRADGAPIVVFRAAGQILAAVGAAGSTFEVPVPLAPTALGTGTPAVAADARGGAAASWAVDPTPAEGDEVIRVAELGLEPDASAPPPAAAPPAPAPPPPPPPPSPVEPSTPSAPSAPLRLTNVGVDPQCIRYGEPFARNRKRLTFSFGLSDTASVQLTIQRRLNSRPVRRCPLRRVPGEPGRLGQPVVVDVAAGAGTGAVSVGDEGEAISARAAGGPRSAEALRRRMKSGSHEIRLQAPSTTFEPGTYVARLTATSGDGRRSETLKVKFWILVRPGSR